MFPTRRPVASATIRQTTRDKRRHGNDVRGVSHYFGLHGHALECENPTLFSPGVMGEGRTFTTEEAKRPPESRRPESRLIAGDRVCGGPVQ